MSIEDQGVVGAVGDSGSGGGAKRQKGRLDGSAGKERGAGTGIGANSTTSKARHPARLLPSQQASLGIPPRASNSQIPIRYGGIWGDMGKNPPRDARSFAQMAGAQPLRRWLVLVWKRDLW